ncbi:MAG: minor capsid protein [Clostridium paraputrificum]
MKNSEYWEKRIANTTWKTYNSLEEKNKALLEMYQEASLSISDELYRVSEKMKTSTPTLSDMHKFNRLTNLQKNIENIIRELGENVEIFGKKNMQDGFIETYSNIMTKLGITKFDEVPKKVMEEMLRKPWLGSDFSTRLWKNTQVLATNLNDLLTNGIIQGKTITEIAIQLNNRMNEGFNVAHRLIRTETMHYLNESAKKAYKDGGCKDIQLWAAVDERVCKVCGSKHGNIYNLKDCPTLPLHANCRCTILPVIDEKSAKNDNIKAKKEINSEFNRRKNTGYKYNSNGTIVVTEDHKGERYSILKEYKPYAVIETSTVYKNGYEQIDRTLYDKNGMMSIQIHSGHHNKPKQHPFGVHGEHMHIYKWDKDGNRKSRDTIEITEKYIRENIDILRRE